MGDIYNTPLLFKDRSKMTKEEKLQYIQDLEYEQLALKNHWTDEERKLNREKFDKEYKEQREKERRIARNVMNIALDRTDEMSDFEIRQTEKYIEKDPEMLDLANGLLNMVALGANDAEHLEKYM